MKRMRALVAVTLLVAWPTLAGAECAWVLWAQSLSQRPEEPATERISRWDPNEAYQTRSDCVAAIERYSKMLPAGKQQDGTIRVWFYRCLPDTVRPQ